jgi:1-acyl-sn-glycerol-3-phosphate acyltransferase
MRLPPTPVRRVLLPLQLVVLAAVLAFFTMATVVGAAAAPFGSRRRPLRISALGVAYGAVELAVIARAGLLWLRRPRVGRLGLGSEESWLDTNQALLVWALARILGAARRCLGLVVTVEPPDPPSLGGAGPILVLARHAGPGDSLALAHLLMSRYGRRVRIVLKEVLQIDPALDLLLNRLNSCFLPSSAAGKFERAQRVGRAAGSLRSGEALLLFPEGANWTPGRRWRLVGQLRRRREASASRAAVLMTNVLPPRSGGVLACLEARPDLEVVVLAHAGLDRIASVRQALDAVPFSCPVTVRMWPAATPPATEDGRIFWLMAEWAVLDEWVDRYHAQPTGVPSSPARPGPD